MLMTERQTGTALLLRSMLRFLLMVIAAGLILAGCSDNGTDSDDDLAPPGNPFPANGANIVALTPVFSWSSVASVSGPVTYDVHLGTRDTMRLVSSAQSDTTYAPDSLTFNTTYTWRVVAGDGAGRSSSSQWRFSTTTRVVAASRDAPDPVDVNDPAWDDVDEFPIGLFKSLGPSGTASAALGELPDDHVNFWANVKVINSGDELFVRLQWPDTSFSVWKNPYTVVSETPPIQLVRDTLFHWEDQVFVMFAKPGPSDWGWDTWNWRALTTQAGNLAEGFRFFDGTLYRDDGHDSIAVVNPPDIASRPQYVHKDTSEFNGYVLYIDDTVGGYTTTGGWTQGQRVPGWMIDSAAARQLYENRPGRWDIRSGFAYDSALSVYTIVLSRELSTSQPVEDLDMQVYDSVNVQIGIYDNQMGFAQASSRRRFSEEFWLILAHGSP